MGCSNDCSCGSCCPGPRGEQGEQGETGSQGLTGASGASGSSGGEGIAGPSGGNGIDGFGYNSSSVNSINVLDIPSTTVNFTIDSEKAYTPGARIRMSDVGNPTTNYFEGEVTAYNPTTGAITVASIDVKEGSGTHASWNINLAGEIGSTGIDGVQGIQGPAGVAGPQGPIGNTGAAGTNGTDIYDSGWKAINDHTIGQGFGLAPIGWANPQVRVIGRTVYLDGIFMIPLAEQGVSTNLRTNYLLYPSTNKTDVETYTGVDGGFALSVSGSLTSQSPILPLELRPEITNRVVRSQRSSRSVQDTAGLNSVTLEAILKSIDILPSGEVFITTHKDIDDSSGSPIPNSPMHFILSKVTAVRIGIVSLVLVQELTIELLQHMLLQLIQRQ
jgi:hypothetical protein